MKLCPNCKNPFEEKVGLLHCLEHGWHGLNESGEIIPANEPDLETIKAWEQSQTIKEKGDAAVVDQPGEPQTPADPVPVEAVTIPAISPNAILMITAAAGVLLIVLALVGAAKQKKRAAVI